MLHFSIKKGKLLINHLKNSNQSEIKIEEYTVSFFSNISKAYSFFIKLFLYWLEYMKLLEATYKAHATF